MAVAPCGTHNLPYLSPNQRIFSYHPVSPSHSIWNRMSGSFVGLRNQNSGFQKASKLYLMHDWKGTIKRPSLSSYSRGCLVYAYNPNSDANSKLLDQKHNSVDGMEPFRGKSGSISFSGLTHHLVEEGKLVSAPFKENSGSLLWVLAPVALISSVLLPQFMGLAIDGFFKDEIISEIVASMSSEVMFYIGLAVFLFVTDRTQRPYLQFSPKRWSLITGLKGYLASAFFTMGFKIFAPILAAFVTWPLLGLPAVISVAPLLAGCLAQFVFEKVLDKNQSSCWPLVPIIFEVYRLYQLSRAMHFMEKLMFSMRGLPASPEVMERSGALAAMIVTFEVLAVVCIWSFLTFVQRLFPSRPVAENY